MVLPNHLSREQCHQSAKSGTTSSLTHGDITQQHNGDNDNKDNDDIHPAAAPADEETPAKPNIAAKPNIIINSGYIYSKHEETLIDLGGPEEDDHTSSKK